MAPWQRRDSDSRGVIGLVVAGVVVGPEGIGLIKRSGMIAQLGGVGLLYLMFMAGLELDLAVLFDHGRSAVVFGMLTFAIPITLGRGVALWLGFRVAAAVLVGSLWASHSGRLARLLLSRIMEPSTTDGHIRAPDQYDGRLLLGLRIRKDSNP